MQAKLMNLNRSAWYWGGLVLSGLLVLGVALYFQYVRNEWPCVLCIHARIWVLGVSLAALLGLVVRRHLLLNVLAHGLVMVMATGLLDRAWLLLGTERGTVFGDCSMDSGLPFWFALDKWFPQLFEVQASCGYTPELWPGGLTMAEGLLGIAVILIILSALQLLLGLLRWRQS